MSFNCLKYIFYCKSFHFDKHIFLYRYYTNQLQQHQLQPLNFCVVYNIIPYALSVTKSPVFAHATPSVFFGE